MSTASKIMLKSSNTEFKSKAKPSVQKKNYETEALKKHLDICTEIAEQATYAGAVVAKQTMEELLKTGKTEHKQQVLEYQKNKAIKALEQERRQNVYLKIHNDKYGKFWPRLVDRNPKLLLRGDVEWHIVPELRTPELDFEFIEFMGKTYGNDWFKKDNWHFANVAEGERCYDCPWIHEQAIVLQNAELESIVTKEQLHTEALLFVVTHIEVGMKVLPTNINEEGTVIFKDILEYLNDKYKHPMSIEKKEHKNGDWTVVGK